METLFSVFEREASDLQRDFAKASQLGEGTPQEIAEFRENAFRSLVTRFYPHPFRVVKGKIRDSYSDSPSASIDCIIVNPEHPNLLDSQGKLQLLFADGVDIAIEVKPDLENRSELLRGLKQCESVKSLRRVSSPLLQPDMFGEEVLQFSRQIPFFIFAVSAPPAETLIGIVREFYETNSVPIENQIDFIVINNVGIVVNVKSALRMPWVLQQPPEKHVGFYFEHWKSLTIGGMLLAMNRCFHSRLFLQDSVLTPYLQKLSRDVTRFADPTTNNKPMQRSGDKRLPDDNEVS